MSVLEEHSLVDGVEAHGPRLLVLLLLSHRLGVQVNHGVVSECVRVQRQNAVLDKK